VQYYIRSRTVEEKCSFDWNIGSVVDSRDTTFEIEIPRDFTDPTSLKTFRPKMKIQNSAKIMMSGISNSQIFKACFKLSVRYGEGKSAVLLQRNKCWQINDLSFKMNMTLDELKAKKNLYFPNGDLVIHCDFGLTHVSTIVENVKFGCGNDLNFFKDSKNGSIIAGVNEELSRENLSLKRSLYTMYKERELCDVTLRAGSATFPCHKTVLCARSPVFRAMFANDMTEKQKGFVDIVDVDSQTLDLFLTSLYTDSLNSLDWETALKIYSVADKYDVLAVRKECSSFLSWQLSESNVCDVLLLADVHQYVDLSKQAQNFFLKHAKNIVHSDKWIVFMRDHLLLAAEMIRLSI